MMRKRTAPRRRAAAKKGHGEDFLGDIEAVILTLENGTQVRISIADELQIPTDPLQLTEEVRRAASRLAFWGYQTERALNRVRKLEVHVQSEEGGDYICHRKHLVLGGVSETYDVHTEAIRVTDKMVQAHMDCAPTADTCKAREQLQAAREQYGTLRAVRDALQQRCFLIELLIRKQLAQRD